MSLQLNPNSGLAFRNRNHSGKAPHFKGEILIEGKRIELAMWENVGRDGETYYGIKVQDAVAAEIERAEKRLEYLRNQSEQPESRDELAEKPDRVEKTMASNKQRKIA